MQAFDVLFTRHDLDEALEVLVRELVAGDVKATIRIVGGAAVAIQVGREALTEDIDAFFASSHAVQEAVQRIAEMRGWPTTWLNDAAKMFASHYVTDEDWDVWIARKRVAVLVARPPLLLAMKLRAGRGRRDSDDIAKLLDACAVESFVAAEDLFEHYYPDDEIAVPALHQLAERFPNP